MKNSFRNLFYCLLSMVISLKHSSVRITWDKVLIFKNLYEKSPPANIRENK